MRDKGPYTGADLGGRRRFGTIIRLVLPAVLAVILFYLATFSLVLPAFEHTVMERKREMISELTRVGRDVLTHYQEKAASGEMTRDQAQSEALAMLRSFRYGPEEKDYFWVNDTEPRMIMHPYRPDLEGRDLSRYADPTGKRLFVELVKKATEDGQGFVDYHWQWMDAPEHVAPKLSHVRAFEPWGWIIGTGIYLEDVRQEMAAMSRRLKSISVVILVLIALLSVYLIAQSIRSQGRRLQAEKELMDSQRMLRLVLDQMPLLIYWKDQRGDYLGCNQRFASFFDYQAPAAVVGRNDGDLPWAPEQGARHSARDREVMAAGRAVGESSTQYQTKSGEKRWMEVNRAPLLDGRGRIVGVLGVIQDITERRRTMMALTESERRFRTLVEQSLVGIFIVQNGRVMYTNPEQKRLFGTIPEPFDLNDFRDAPEEDLAKLRRLCDPHSPAMEWPLEMELRFFPHGAMSEGRDMRWVHCRADAITHQGETALLVIMMDITKAKEYEHLLMVQDKMASLGRVAAGIAHEIRNPLSGINLYVSALEDAFQAADPVAEDQARSIFAKIKTASEKIERVVKRVLDFSRPTRPNLSWVDVNQIIESVLEFSAVTLRKNGIKLETSLAEGPPPVHADPQLIEQVLMNLMANAIQAAGQSERRPAIFVSSAVEKRRVVVRVADTGPGVAPEIRHRIFDPFFTIKRDGSGIGLSLSRRIIEDHGGELTVTAGAWGGAEFVISLPAWFKAWYDSVG